MTQNNNHYANENRYTRHATNLHAQNKRPEFKALSRLPDHKIAA
jgi:hypothetical protein